MRLRVLVIFMLLCPVLVLLSACNDDTIGGEGKVCADKRDCLETQDCVEGRCVKKDDQGGDDCTVKDDCGDDEDCENGRCVKQKPECVNPEDCGDGENCENGRCVKKPECASPEDCALSDDCYQQRCVARISLGDACEVGGLACVRVAKCSDGVCVREFLDEGSECGDAIELQCEPTSMICENGHCVRLPQAGDACDETDPQACYDVFRFQCLDGVCTQYGGAGARCGVSGYRCRDGMYCINNQCVKAAEAGDNCHLETSPCVDGYVCLNQKCVQMRGECKNDDDCKADSYCCTMSACDVKNKCIPYGEGPRGNVNESCEYKTVVGLFDPVLQCEWTAENDPDGYPNHVNVLTTPMVMDTPFVSANNASEIIFPSYNYTDGGGESAAGINENYYGVIRIIDGNTCKVHQSIYDPDNHIIASAPLAIADVDGDGFVEIFTLRAQAQKTHTDNKQGLVMFKWNSETHKYETAWATKQGSSLWTDFLHWDGPSVHKLDDKACAYVISEHEVFDACTGERVNKEQILETGASGSFAVVGKLDKSDDVMLLRNDGAWKWDSGQRQWVVKYRLTLTGTQFAYADFGTAGATAQDFKYGVLDGIAEVVATGSNSVMLKTLSDQLLMDVATAAAGGAPNLSDFDGDGVLEVGVASASLYGIYDPECDGTTLNDGRGNTCEGKNVLWKRVSYDTSARTGSVVFDFDGDGKAEIIYGDECYTRVYEGPTGKVLFSSYRTSCTWYETPVTADVDNDDTVELIVNSNNNCDVKCASHPVDPYHEGLVCEKDKDCFTKSCVNGFCRCDTIADCNSAYDESNIATHAYACTEPLPNSAELGGGKVCRAAHPTGVKQQGVHVLRDRFDRWASSRPIWNQHAYNVTNINDDDTLPDVASWERNYTNPKYNNFRQNVQGELGMNSAPDITGIFEKDNVCGKVGDKFVIGARVCNRGTKLVPDKMPASFYAVAETGEKTKLCTSYTANYPRRRL
ncbi:MAG: hypothetical protein ACOX8U_02540 [Bradymonadia bacterium]|jgi:hypothetical protein